MPTMYRHDRATGRVETRYFSRSAISGGLLAGWSTVRPLPFTGSSAGSGGGSPRFAGSLSDTRRFGRGATGDGADRPVQEPEERPLPPPGSQPITMYRTDPSGEAVSVETDKSALHLAMSQGWSPYRPYDIPSFPVDEDGVPVGLLNRASVEEAVGLYWLNYLGSRPGAAAMPKRVVKVEKATPSGSGSPRYNVTWEYTGMYPMLPLGLDSSSYSSGTFGGPSSTPGGMSANGWRGPTYGAGQPRYTDEVVLVPNEHRPGTFDVMPKHLEPGMLLPEMSGDIIDGTQSYGQVRENDERIAAIFDGMAEGTLSRGIGYWRLSQLVGTEAAKVLDDQAQLYAEAIAQSQGVPITPGTLPRFSEETPMNLLFGSPDSPSMEVMRSGSETPHELWNAFSVGQNYGNIPLDPRLLPGASHWNQLRPLEPGEIYAFDSKTQTWTIKTMDVSNAGIAPFSIDQLIATALAKAFGTSGGYGPSYQAPDRNQVRDSVKATLISLVGRSNDGRLEMLTDVFMNAHRQQFNGSSVDPAQAVKERIRTFDDYKRVQALRPDFIDEMDWIPYQHQGLVQGGMRNIAVERRAITQATAGTAPARAEQAGYLSEFSETGRANMPGFFDRLKSTLASLSKLVG